MVGLVVFLGMEGQPLNGGAAAVQVKEMAQVTEVIVDKLVYGATSNGEVSTVADVVRGLGNEVTEVWVVVDAEADMASLSRLATKPLHEALSTWLALHVYTIWPGLETRSVQLVIHVMKQESHQAGAGNHWADGLAQTVDTD